MMKKRTTTKRTLLCLTITLLMGVMHAQAETKVTKAEFGKMPDGTAIDIYTLAEGKYEVRVMAYGAIVASIKTPDRNGKVADVALGFDTLNDYVKKNDPHFGGTIGRYANRIAHGTFSLDGKTYHVPKNDGDNALHGGPVGFDKAVWQAKQIRNGVEFTHLSPDGDQGFPGNLTVTLRYTLANNALLLEYTATTDQDTVVNLTNHSYFNLKGEGDGDILQHKVQIHAQEFTPVNADLIPTGELQPVRDTPFDFQIHHAVDQRINEKSDQLKLGMGYDHNYVLDNGGKLTQVAEVYSPESGRVLSVSTTEPGLQFYTGNHLDGVKGKGGHIYSMRDGLCLEAQHYPDSPNHPNFPSTELKPGQHDHQTTIYKFSTR
ncbi:MAG: aldose epimerase family protein [Acidobacteriaceae bacterium]